MVSEAISMWSLLTSLIPSLLCKYPECLLKYRYFLLLMLIFLFRMTLLYLFSVPKLIKSLFLTESELYMGVSHMLSVLLGILE